MKKYVVFLTAIVAAVSCDTPSYREFSGYAQGGAYRVKYNSAGVNVPPSEVKQSVDSILTLIDDTFSGYKKSSVLSRFNAGEDVDTTGMFGELTEMCRQFKKESGGALDIGSAPLFDIWGFGFTSDSLPSEEIIRGALARSAEWRNLNFNAVAQGYTCDKVASYLYSIGVKDMLVDIGEIFCDGVNPSGKPWSIGIDNPVDGNNSPGSDIRAIWESDGGPCGVVTSGNYRKYYIKDGKKYSHTIDPRTGYPVRHSLLSATIIAPTATQADAVATTCMVLGPDEAREYILERPELEACLISSDSVWQSSGFRGRNCPPDGNRQDKEMRGAAR